MPQNGINTIINQYEDLFGKVTMTPDEMWRAAIDYQATKDESTMNRLVGANIRLMVKDIIAITHSPNHVDEYIGSAIAGFMDGVNKLDVEKAHASGLTTPATYIFEWVRSYVRFDFNKDNAFLSGINGTGRLVYNKILQLTHSCDMTRDEIIQEVAKELNEPVHIVESVYSSIGARVHKEPLALTEMPDTSFSSKRISQEFDMMEVFPIIQELLTEREMYIVMSRLQEKTLDELGREFNMSKEAIRLQEKKALKKLQKDQRLKEFHAAL